MFLVNVSEKVLARAATQRSRISRLKTGFNKTSKTTFRFFPQNGKNNMVTILRLASKKGKNGIFLAIKHGVIDL